MIILLEKYLFTLVPSFTEHDVSCYLFLLQRELYTRKRKYTLENVSEVQSLVPRRKWWIQRRENTPTAEKETTTRS